MRDTDACPDSSSSDAAAPWCFKITNVLASQFVVFCATSPGTSSTAYMNPLTSGSTADMPSVSNGPPLVIPGSGTGPAARTVVKTIAVLTATIPEDDMNSVFASVIASQLMRTSSELMSMSSELISTSADTISTSTETSISTLTNTSNTAEAAPTTATVPASPTQSSNSAVSNGISAGGIAGAAVGSFIAVALLVGFLIIIFLRRRRERAAKRDSEVPRGTLGGAVLPGAWKSRERDGNATGEGSDGDAVAEVAASPPPMSVNPAGSPKAHETHRARYEGEHMPWSPDSVTSGKGASELPTFSGSPLMPTSLELEGTAVGGYVHYRHGETIFHAPPPALEVEGTSRPDTPRNGTSGDAPSPALRDASSSGMPSPVTAPTFGHEGESQQHFSVDSGAASETVSPLSSPRTGSGGTPSPYTSGLSTLGLAEGRRERSQRPSGMSASGSWAGYLSAEQALAGGWRDEDPMEENEEERERKEDYGKTGDERASETETKDVEPVEGDEAKVTAEALRDNDDRTATGNEGSAGNHGLEAT